MQYIFLKILIDDIAKLLGYIAVGIVYAIGYTLKGLYWLLETIYLNIAKPAYLNNIDPKIKKLIKKAKEKYYEQF